MSDFDELTDLDDAIIEDTTYCQCCNCRLVCGDNDCITIEVPQINGTVAVLTLCDYCAKAVHDTYKLILLDEGG